MQKGGFISKRAETLYSWKYKIQISDILMGFKAGEGYWAVYYNIVLFVGLTTLGALMDFDCLVH